MATKKQVEQHITDRKGEELFRRALPDHWVVHEYRPDYGIDFTIELFGSSKNEKGFKEYETLGEHIFVQLKSKSEPEVFSLPVFARDNVEKKKEENKKNEKIADIDTYRIQLEASELLTVDRMGIGVPVLLVVSDLASQQCCFVCLNDYIDKILVPRLDKYSAAGSRTIHVPVQNKIGSKIGTSALRWYGKRAKLLAAFHRFTYQRSELNFSEEDSWRDLASYFGRRISDYDFWDDTEMCKPISDCGRAIRSFVESGQPNLLKREDGTEHLKEYLDKQDVFSLWEALTALPKMHEDIWREWFLPTALGWQCSSK